MIESVWLTSMSALSEMSALARRTAPGRKLRLVSSAACRLTWERFADPRTERALLACERFADGLADESELAVAEYEATSVFTEALARDERPIVHADVGAVAAAVHSNPTVGLEQCLRWVVEWVAWSAGRGNGKKAVVRIRSQLCTVFREVIGNPFRPWRSVAPFLGGGIVQPDGKTMHLTDTVQQLAHGIHVDQAFDRLPILADALQEAGMTDEALLAHCRNDTRHVRGCWALDVALGRV